MKVRTSRWWLVLLLLVAACGEDSMGPDPDPDPDPDDPSVTVSPPSTNLQTGNQMTFTATTANLATQNVTWSVSGGASNGTITGAGVYQAPAQVPSPATVTVRATSVDDTSVSDTGTVTITAPTPELFSNLGVALRGSSESTVAVEQGFGASMSAIFDVSVAQQQTVTTGTFTLVGQSWQYQAQPNDRMVVQATGAPELTITWTKFLFADDIESADDLMQAHDVAGQMAADGLFDIAFTSINDSRCCGNGGYSYSYNGSFQFAGESWIVIETGSASSFFDVGGGSTEYESDERVTGNYTSATRQLQIDYRHEYESIFVDNFVDDSRESIASAYTENGTTYQYVGATQGSPAFIRQLTFNSEPSELDKWRAEGGILRNGQLFGVLSWEQQLDNSFKLVLRSPDGTTILTEF